MSDTKSVVPFARQIFDHRFDEVVTMLRRDREKLCGWEEPANLRATLRRSVREFEDCPGGYSLASMHHDFARTAGEPERGEQRQSLGQLLDAGCSALLKICCPGKIILSEEEEIGLEAVLVLYGRPALATHGGTLAPVPSFWDILDEQKDDIEQVQSAVGRIELQGSAEFDWAGTAFLVSPHTAVTALSNIEAFATFDSCGQYHFRYGINASINFNSDYECGPEATCQVVRVTAILRNQELALLEVKPSHPEISLPKPLRIAYKMPQNAEGRNVYLVGYPIRDARRNEPERLARIFRDLYNVKRVQPGTLRRVFVAHGSQKLEHDCTTLGHSAGACIVDLATHEVLGVHLSSRFLEDGIAVALWPISNHPCLPRQTSYPWASETPPVREDSLSKVGAVEAGSSVGE